MVAADMVECCQDLVGDDLSTLDGLLRAQQLPTLTAMRDRSYRRALQILARDAIRNESEWHVLNAYVTDVEDRVLSPEERARADRLLHEYRRRSNDTK